MKSCDKSNVSAILMAVRSGAIGFWNVYCSVLGKTPYIKFLNEKGAMALEKTYLSIVADSYIAKDLKLLRAAGLKKEDLQYYERSLLNASASLDGYLASEWASGRYSPEQFNSSREADWDKIQCASLLEKDHK
jgi:hypothetical protein